MVSELERLCEARRVKIESTYGAVELPEGWARDAHPYKVTLRYQGRRLTVPFFMGSAHTSEPSAADVISCLCSDARSGEQSFEDFAGEFGYDVDSRKAEKTWRQCVATGPRVRRLLGADFEAFANAEH
jgi:hypothetical protein